MVTLSNPDLAIAAILVLVLALLSARLQAGISRQLLIAAARTAIQLTLIGLVITSYSIHYTKLYDRSGFSACRACTLPILAGIRSCSPGLLRSTQRNYP